MARNYPRRIGAAGVDYEGIYEFYRRLERREQAAALWKIFMAVSVPVVFLVFSYLSAHYVNWKPVTASVSHFM